MNFRQYKVDFRSFIPLQNRQGYCSIYFSAMNRE